MDPLTPYNNSKPKKIKIQDINFLTKIMEFPWGKVYSGQTKGSNKRSVMIKMISKDDAIKKKHVDLLYREIKFCGYLMCPFIVKYFYLFLV